MKNAFKLMKRLIVVLFTAVALVSTGCKEIEYHQLSDDDMSWLVYKNYEVDVFSNGTETVSYYVTIRTKSYDESGDTYNEYTKANFLLLNDSTAYFEEDSKGVLYIYKQMDESLLVTLSWPHFPIKEVPLTSMPISNDFIGGVLYSDLYIVDATGLTDARFYISKIWYSKSEGMMQYEDRLGNLWVKDI